MNLKIDSWILHRHEEGLKMRGEQLEAFELYDKCVGMPVEDTRPSWVKVVPWPKSNI